MGIITTKKSINLVGIGELPAGVKVSFKANFKERNQGLVCHTIWYKDQAAYDNGIEITAQIQGLASKDNISIDMNDFSNEELQVLAQATEIVQAKVLAKIEQLMNESDFLEIV
jgi:hypothetical protein